MFWGCSCTALQEEVGDWRWDSAVTELREQHFSCRVVIDSGLSPVMSIADSPIVVKEHQFLEAEIGDTCRGLF